MNMSVPIYNQVVEAHNRTQRIMTLKQSIGRCAFALGHQLKLVKEAYDKNPQTAYEVYQHENFNQYRAQPGIQFSAGTVNRFVRLYQKYIVELGLSEDSKELQGIDYTVLDQMRNVLTPENVQEWLEKAASLGRMDLMKELSGKSDADCPHASYEIYEVHICKFCNEQISKRSTT